MRHRPLNPALLAILTGTIFSLAPSATRAQDKPPAPQPPPAQPVDPRIDPVLHSQGADELTLEMLQRRDPPPPVKPVAARVRIVVPPDIGQATNPFIDDVSAAGLGDQPALALPEGTFLSRRRGSIIKTSAGGYIFLPHPDTAGGAERAMVILPSPGLAQIQDDLNRTGPRAVALMSGEVLQYRGQNYILPLAFNLVPAEQLGATPAAPSDPATPPAPAPEGAPAPAERDAAPTPVPASTEPTPPPAAAPVAPPPAPASTESLISDIENRRGQPRSISRPSTTPAPAQAAPGTPGDTSPAIQAVADRLSLGATLLTDRRARITRLPDGRVAMAFDRGFSRGPEVTMPLLECKTLERLELYVFGPGDTRVFTVSGRVIPYRGSRYLLLTGFQPARPDEIGPLQ